MHAAQELLFRQGHTTVTTAVRTILLWGWLGWRSCCAPEIRFHAENSKVAMEVLWQAKYIYAAQDVCLYKQYNSHTNKQCCSDKRRADEQPHGKSAIQSFQCFEKQNTMARPDRWLKPGDKKCFAPPNASIHDCSDFLPALFPLVSSPCRPTSTKILLSYASRRAVCPVYNASVLFPL